ncbi:TetR/AcrR family transcriptional regulator [Ruminococcaceae bacterium OttesenSCG-928-D13]|nr:TetR/AcrR family transcriptional regulator [Ruminococcaceae bacterium OttesenSCG-928-D13]
MRSKADTTREHIIRVATDMFFKNGYENTFTKEIAAEADISEALLYKYYSSKEKLYIEVFQSVIEAHTEETENYFSPEQPLEWLYTFAKDLIQPDDNTPRVAIMFAQVMRIQAKHFVMWAIEMGEFHPILTDIFVKGQKIGQITTCDSPDRLAYVYYRFLVGLIIDDMFFPKQQPLDSIKAVSNLFSAQKCDFE